MRSIKNSIQLNKSLKKQRSSGKRLNSGTYRQPLNQPFTLTKSTTHKLLSSKDVKLNNFFEKDCRDCRVPKTARTYNKKSVVKNCERNQKEALLMKKSDKMKLVFWNQDTSLDEMRPVVVSADFVVNQDLFWQKVEDPKLLNETIKVNKNDGPPMVKEWRQLHKNYFVIWIVRSRRAWMRIQLTISTYGLPVHAIFLVKKKRNYIVDYSPVVRQIEKHQKIGRNLQNITNRTYTDDDSLSIFQTVKVNLKDLVVYDSYAGKIPALIGAKAKVILMRMQYEPPGLECIQRAMERCKKPQSALECPNNQSYTFSSCRMIKLNSARKRQIELYPCLSIRTFIQSYLRLKQTEYQQEEQLKERPKEEDWFYEEEIIDGVIEEMKRKLISNVINNQGRGYQFQGGLSIYNFIGEMFKRNHKILFDTRVDSMYAQIKDKFPQKTFQKKNIDLKDVNLNIDYYELQWR